MYDLERIPAGVLPDQESRTLLSAAQQLGAARSLAQVTEAVRRAARELTRADGVTFVLREGDQVHYVDEEALSPLWKGCRFPAGACISGWAMDHAETVVIEDIYADPRIPHDLYRPTFVRSLAMVPVGTGDPVAAIGAYWARHHRASPTEVKRLEVLAGFAALALANDALVRELRDALQAREDFLTVAAHELRTPLTALLLSAEAGLRARGAVPDAPDPLRLALTRCQAHARRLQVLVDAMLEVADGRSSALPLARERTDLAALAQGVIERVRPDARTPIAFSAGEPLWVSCDVARVEQALEHLVGNALKFGEGRPVEVRAAREGGEACLSVRDEGIGIPAGEQARIFDKFARAVSVRNYGGLGLGLWIVRQNVEAHGGSVAAESAPGAGTRFTIRLPLE